MSRPIPVLPPTEELPEFNENYIYFWNNVMLDLIRLVTTQGTNGSVYGGPPASARALGILHLAIHDSYFGIKPDQANRFTTYLTPGHSNPLYRLPELLNATDPRDAVAGASVTVLRTLFTTPSPSVATAVTNALSSFILQRTNLFHPDTLSASYRFGVAVGQAMLNLLNIQPGEPGFDQDSYAPTPGRYKFNDDPTNPVRVVPVDPNNPSGPTTVQRVYNAPFYGMTAKRLAVQYEVNGTPTEHIIADPPKADGDPDNFSVYNSAFIDVYRLGGAATLESTIRTPSQTTSGFFWAYDATNLIGTPLRNYNQILRQIAWQRRPGAASGASGTSEEANADFARLFALVNVSLADAGIFAWQEKYCFEYWRPLTGVRDDIQYGNPLADPFWLTLGSPETNANEIAFKPPFPSVPSGHATFGGAGFQAMRLYYHDRDGLDFPLDGADNISFTAVSDELNGLSRDLRVPYNPTQPITDQVGTVRTRVPKTFKSLWDAIFDNAISRLYLGVHWSFDAFWPPDVVAMTNAQGISVFRDSDQIRYTTLRPRSDRPGQLFPVGGVPLGIQIANDIYQHGLRPTPPEKQPSGRNKCGDTDVVINVGDGSTGSHLSGSQLALGTPKS
ncbi:MAG: hypothetical protein Q9227_005131 [Pyrenula ochraceoflavens]